MDLNSMQKKAVEECTPPKDASCLRLLHPWLPAKKMELFEELKLSKPKTLSSLSPCNQLMLPEDINW